MKRPQQSAREIAALPPLESEEIERHLEEHGWGLAAETLVYLIRDFQETGRAHLSERCFTFLFGELLPGGAFQGGRCEPLLRKWARVFGAGDPDLENEFRQRCYLAVFEEILAGRERQPIWEERFFLRLKSRALDIGESLRAERERAAPLDPESVDTEWHAGDEGELLAELAARRLQALIARLPKRQRQAAWLRWVEGYRIQSIDPDEETVSSLMGISDSMVRRYLREARKALREDPILVEEAKERGYG